MSFYSSNSLDALNTTVLIGGAVLVTSILCGKDIIYTLDDEQKPDRDASKEHISYMEKTLTASENLVSQSTSSIKTSGPENFSSEMLRAALNEHRELLRKSSQELQIARNKSDETERSLEASERELTELRAKSSSQGFEISALKDQLARLLDQAHESIKSMFQGQANEGNQDQIAILESRIASLLTSAAEGDKEKASAFAALEKAQAELRSSNNVISDLQSKLYAFEASYESKGGQVDTLRAALDKAQESIKSLLQGEQSSKSLIETSASKQRDLELENARLQKKLQENLISLEDLQFKFDDLTKASEAESSSLNGIIKTFKTELRSSNAEVTSLKEELEAAKQSLARGQPEKQCTKCSALEKQLASALQNQGDLSEIVSAAAHFGYTTGDDLTDALNELNENREVVDGLTQELDDSKKKLVDLQVFMKEQQKSFAADAKSQQDVIEKLKAGGAGSK